MDTRKILPNKIDIIIEKSDTIFDVVLNEIPWMFCDVNIGKKVVWGMYDNPNHNLVETFKTETTRKARIHGIDCIESEVMEFNSKGELYNELKYYSKVTDDMLQFIANIYTDGETVIFDSIYDEDFYKNFGVEDKRVYKYDEIKFVYENIIESKDLEIIGGSKVFNVKINGIPHECLRVIQRTKVTSNIIVETYIDSNGDTILFRRYNSEEHNYKGMKGKWKEQYPSSQIIKINNEEYIHWYDCISNKSLKKAV